MGSLSRAAIAACIVLISPGTQSSGGANADALSVRTTGLSDVALLGKKKHPSSRETVSGPWPRFAKKMLA